MSALWAALADGGFWSYAAFVCAWLSSVVAVSCFGLWVLVYWAERDYTVVSKQTLRRLRSKGE